MSINIECPFCSGSLEWIKEKERVCLECFNDITGQSLVCRLCPYDICAPCVSNPPLHQYVTADDMDYIITKINSTQKKFTCVIESFKEFACDCGDMCAILNCFDIEERCFLLDAMKGRIVDPEHKARILRCFPNEWQEEAIRILDMVKKPCRFKYPTQKAPQVVLHPHSSQHKPTQRPVVIHKQQNYAPKKKRNEFLCHPNGGLCRLCASCRCGCQNCKHH